MYHSLTPKEIYKRMFKNAGVYGIGTLLLKGGYLLILPVYWTLLTPDDFGVVGIAQVLTLFLSPLFEIGFFGAVQRLYYTWEESERGKYLAAMWFSNVICGLTVCILLSLSGPWIFPHIFKSVQFFPYLLVTLWTAFFGNFCQIPLGLMRIREETKSFTLYNSAQFFFQHISSILLIKNLSAPAPASYLYGQLLGSLIVSIFYIRFVLKELKFPFEKKHIAEPLKYAYPSTIGAVFEGGASALDRFFLDRYVSLSQIGLFTNGRQIGSGLNVVNFILKTAATPLMYRIASDRKDAPALIGKISLIYTLCMLFPALLISLLAKEAILFVNKPAYFEVYQYVPIFVLGFFILSLSSNYGRGMDLARKTTLMPLVPITWLVAGICSIVYLTPRYGAIGAAWAYVVATACRVTVEVSICHYYYPRPMYLTKVGGAWLLTVLTFLIGYNLPNEWPLLVSCLVKIILVAICAVMTILWVYDWKQIKKLIFKK